MSISWIGHDHSTEDCRLDTWGGLKFCSEVLPTLKNLTTLGCCLTLLQVWKKIYHIKDSNEIPPQRQLFYSHPNTPGWSIKFISNIGNTITFFWFNIHHTITCSLFYLKRHLHMMLKKYGGIVDFSLIFLANLKKLFLATQNSWEHGPAKILNFKVFLACLAKHFKWDFVPSFCFFFSPCRDFLTFFLFFFRTAHVLDNTCTDSAIPRENRTSFFRISVRESPITENKTGGTVAISTVVWKNVATDDSRRELSKCDKITYLPLLHQENNERCEPFPPERGSILLHKPCKLTCGPSKKIIISRNQSPLGNPFECDVHLQKAFPQLPRWC